MARNRAQILITAVDETRRAFRSIEGSLTRLRDQAGRVGDTLRNIGGAIGVGLGLREMAEAADQYKGLQARLQLAVTSQEAFNRADRELFDIAQRNRAPLSATVTLYAKLAPSIRALGRDQRDALTVTEAISQSVALSGASEEAASGALLQFGQALAAGQLRGDEFNSVIEQTPRLAQAIADGLGVPLGALRALAQQGKLTAEVVLDALLGQKERLAQEYAALPDTVSGALTRLRNAFLRAFGERDAGSGFTAGLARAIQFLAAHIDLLIQLAGTALVAALGRMVASIAASMAASRAEAAARLNNLRLIEAEATARLRAARAVLAQATAQGKAATALRADLARAAQEALKARRAVTAAAQGTTLLARAGGLLRGALALLGGPIGLIVTGLGLLATAAFSARDKVVAFGGKTASIGQIVSAAWDLVTEKIGVLVDALTSLVGINDETWASLRETVIDGVNAIGRAVRSFVNGIIGSFNAVGKVVGITAAFLVRRFKRAFSDIAALARALGRDIAAAFKGDFSLRHLKAALRAGRDEMRGFGKALGDAVKESLGRDYVGETARAIAARIRSEQKRQRLFARPQPKGAPSSEDNAARLKLAQAQSDAELRILKEGLAQASRALDRALADRLISIRDYYAQKTAIEQREIDAEIARKQQALAAQRRVLREAGDEKARLDAKGRIAKLEADLIALNNRRAEAEVANARKAAAAERELRDALAQARDELTRLTGTGTDAQRREAIARAYGDLRARLLAENDTAGVSLIDRLVDVKAAQANLDALESKWRLIVERMRNVQEAIRIQQQAGLLTEAQAREQIVRLQRQSAAELEKLLPLMKQAARAIGPEAVARVQAWKNELARTRLVVDEVAVRVKGQVQDAFATMFEQISSGAKSARGAFRDFARSVIASINRIAAQKLAQSLFGNLSGGIGGFVGALFRGFAAGGYVTGPGTSTSDSIPARLSAGEYVINAASVKKVGVAFLDAINGGVFAPRWRGPNLAFATGGLVPNAGRQEKPQVNVRVVNAVDESLVGDFLATPAGEQVITNVIRRNAATVRQYLGS
ncbi:tape measure protein [Hahella sp. SMD15-11]|uniref:Tape measure protein n=1 Tax=Thermohahella caldifontis TaxID=3142973 RepID=A0AB39V0N9_9GAMM